MSDLVFESQMLKHLHILVFCGRKPHRTTYYSMWSLKRRLEHQNQINVIITAIYFSVYVSVFFFCTSYSPTSLSAFRVSLFILCPFRD